MAADWIHCNGCIRQPTTDCPFFLTSCGHIFCHKCIDRGCTTLVCRVCQQKATSIEINRQLKADTRQFFQDPKQVAAQQHKQLCRIIEFQDGHRKRLNKHFQDQQKKVSKMVQHFQTEMKKRNEIEKRNRTLQVELKRLQEENQVAKSHIFQLTAGQHRTPPGAQYRSRTRSPATDHRTPSNSLLASFESAVATSTPSDPSGPTNMTTLANRMSLASGQRTRGTPEVIVEESFARSEITTPKILGLNDRNPMNPYGHMWENRCNQNRSTPPARLSTSRGSNGSSGGVRTVPRNTSPATFLNGLSGGLGFSFNSNTLPRS